MINEMQTSQSFLPFDDHAGLFAYYINESDSCPGMAPNQMTQGDLLQDQNHGNSHLNQSQPHMGATNDHPYSRIERGESRPGHQLSPITNTVNYVGSSPSLPLPISHRINQSPVPDHHHHHHQHLISHHLQPQHPSLHNYVQQQQQQQQQQQPPTNDTCHHPMFNSSYQTSNPPMIDHGSPEQCRGLIESSSSPSSGNNSSIAPLSDASPSSSQRAGSASLVSASLSYTSSSVTKSQESEKSTSGKSETENCSKPEKIPLAKPSPPQVQTTHEESESPLIKCDSTLEPLNRDQVNEKIAPEATITAEVRVVSTHRVVKQIYHDGKVLHETLIEETPVVVSIGTTEWKINEDSKNSDAIMISSKGESSPQPTSSSKFDFGSIKATSKKPNEFKQAPSTGSHVTESRSSSSAGKSTSVSSRKSGKTIHQREQNQDNKVNKSQQHSDLSSCQPSATTSLESTNQSSFLKRKSTFVAIGGKKSKKALPAEANERKKNKEIIESERDRERETASALLSLKGDSLLVKEDEVMILDEKREPDFRPIEKNNRVFAKWARDKNFYPGKVTSPQTDSKWLITFDDGEKRSVHESEIISLPYLCPGQQVMLTYSEDFCAKRVIKRCIIKNGDVKYEIEKEGMEDRPVPECHPSKDFFLTPEMAAVLLSKQSKSPLNASKYADVDLNNIIPKRSRVTTAKTSQTTANDDQESIGEPETMLTGGSSNKSTKCKSSFSKQFLPSMGPPTPISEIPSSKSKKTSSGKHPPSLPVTIKRATTNTAEAPLSRPKSVSKPLVQGERETLLGPIPPEGSDLFQGIGFLLTKTDRITKPTNGEMISSEAGRSIPFDPEYLITQIQMGGGKVFNTLETAKASTEIREIILIAYTYLKSTLYMQCLAAGIPCVMHTWVIECCREGQLLQKTQKYLLPSGYSIINSSLPTDKNVFKKSANLFKGVKIMIADPKLVDGWSPVLTTAQATIVTSLPASIGSSTRKAPSSVDLIVADNSCPAPIVKKAQQMNIPIVTSEYLAQCLINGKRLLVDAHDIFNYK